MLERATRRTFVTATAALAGCGGRRGGSSTASPSAAPTGTRSSSDNPVVGDAEQVGSLRLRSSAFEDGEPIPRKYGHDERNVNPPLSIDGVPSDAKSLTLIVDDPDAVEPAGKVWLHWLVWNIPPSRTSIPEDWSPTDATEGTNDFGTRGYGGPAPPDGTHTYRFKLYALDARLDLSASADERRVGDAMAGHVLSRTQLTGTYGP